MNFPDLKCNLDRYSSEPFRKGFLGSLVRRYAYVYLAHVDGFLTRTFHISRLSYAGNHPWR